MNDPEVQLQIIAEVTRILSGLDIEHWLFGGWGLDFLVGRVTRPHDDVDFFVWTEDFDDVVAALEPLGYQLRPEASDSLDESAFVNKLGYWVEFVKIERSARGDIVTPGRYRDWPWPVASFAGPPLRFRGISVPGWDAFGHWHIKLGYAHHGTKDPLRACDLRDIELLIGLTGDLRDDPRLRFGDR